MKTNITVGAFLLAVTAALGSTAQTKKPHPPKERILIACPEPNHFVEVGWKKLVPPEKACQSKPNVQPTSSDLIWVFGRVEIEPSREKP